MLSLPGLLLAVLAAPQDPAAALSFPESWLALEAVDALGRRPFRPDAVFERHLLRRGAPPPHAGEELVGEAGEARTWRRLDGVDGDVALPGLAWAYTEVTSDRERVVLARLAGASTLFVDGDGFAGDLYRFGFGGVPVRLREGVTGIYVTGVRGSFRLTLEEPPADVFCAPWGATRPDLVDGGLAGPVGLVAVNATLGTVRGARAVLRLGAGDATADPGGPAQDLPPLGVAPLRARVVGAPDPDGEALEALGSVVVDTDVESTADPVPLRVAVAAPGATHRRTYVSEVDGSVQGFAVVPPREPGPDERPRPMGLALSLHGASVAYLGQARCYAPKPDFWVVAPSNRRPYGFDWQDWGRRDAEDVLDRALAFTGVAPERVYLTGHSMGGHGTWHVAANDPDRFAAIAPSAGWESFDTYGGRPAGSLRELWHSADGASRTVDLVDNLAQLPTYVLHGTADETVPADEARAMLAMLREAGSDPRHHFEEGAGHWWGNACVDWPPIFDFFRAHVRPTDPQRIAFTGVDPGVDARHFWVTVLQPMAYGSLFEVRGARAEEERELRLTTANVRALALAPPAGWATDAVVLDGERLPVTGAGPWGFLRGPDGWRAGTPAAGEKGPERSGPFKRVFDRRVLLVHGTAGEPAETRELLARARYDAQVFWYRGNGNLEVVADVDLDPAAARGRNVVLYGNRDTNAAWSALVPTDGSLDVRRGAVRVGSRTFEGDALGCLFVAPRADDPSSLVGAFGSTGPSGARLGYTLAPFVSGVGYPDYAAFGPEVLRTGDAGVRAAGWLAADWTLPPSPREPASD